MAHDNPLIVTALPFRGPQLGAFEKGQAAARAGRLREECPYISQRGRFRLAWLEGFDSVKPRATTREKASASC